MDIFVVSTFFFASLSAALIGLVQVCKRRLVAEQARFQASINSINVGFMITDTNGEVAMINTAAKQIIFNPNATSSPAIFRNSPAAYFRYSIDEIQQRLGSVYDIKSKLQKVLIEKTTISDQNVAFGELFLHIFITPIVILERKGDLGLDYIGAVVLIEDITQRLMLERSKDEFFSIASHELRTPLTAIRGNTALIQQYFAGQIKDPSLKEMIEDIHQSSTRLIDIVNEFLNVSRIEQSRIQYHKASLGILGLAKEVTEELMPLATQKGLYLRIEEGISPPIVYADKDRVKEVLVNLIGNALKFTTQGGIAIRFISEGHFVKCSVIDTGKGMAPPNQKLLFRKFQQAGSNILTRDMNGTGLGLYISKLMIEAMGGKIWLEASQEGRGSIFSFTLPVMDSTPQSQPLPTSSIQNPPPQLSNSISSFSTSIGKLTSAAQT